MPQFWQMRLTKSTYQADSLNLFGQTKTHTGQGAGFSDYLVFNMEL
tara:strand:- start:4681 stop:4818 length:138 start_codon:yes stop_codon:yes gene_type:complete